MPKIYNVKEGSTLSCSLGSTTSSLKVPQGHGVSVQGKKDLKLKEEMALLNNCILPCICGGIIKIDDDGQNK